MANQTPNGFVYPEYTDEARIPEILYQNAENMEKILADISKVIPTKSITADMLSEEAREELKGAIGPQGPKGDTGAQGKKGDKGEPGEDGHDGEAGADGIRGSQWNSGTAMSHTSGTGSYSGASGALVGDYYLNTTYGYVYRCTTAGSGTTAKWTYQGSIRGTTGATGSTGADGAQGDPGCNASTIVVASPTSRNKAQADYICGTSSAQTQINQAISALSSTGGGKIVLLEGTYNISGSINVNVDNVTFGGMGASTVLKRMFDSGGFYGYEQGVITISKSNCLIRNFKIDGNRSSYPLNKNLGIALYSSSSDIYDNVIEGVDIVDAYNGIINTAAAFRTCVRDSKILNAAEVGIYLYNSTEISVYGNRVIDAGMIGINVHWGASRNKVFNNYIIRGSGQTSDYNSSQYTIYVQSGRDNDISDNYILGKNYVNSGGSTNTFNNNRYQ